MNSPAEFANRFRDIEKAFLGCVLGSVFWSFAASLVTRGNFDPSFQAVATLVGLVSGAAGVSGAFLATLRHPSDDASHVARSRPNRAVLGVLLAMLAVVTLLSAYHWLAQQGTGWALLPLSACSFLFFRAIGSVTSAVSTNARQAEWWDRLTDEERDSFRALEAEQERLTRHLLHDAKEATNEARRVVADVARSRRDSQKRERSQRRRERWLTFRKRLKWRVFLTRTERAEARARQRLAEARLLHRAAELEGKHLSAIASGEAIRADIESLDWVEGYLWQNHLYFVARSRVDEARANELVAMFGELSRAPSLSNRRFELILEGAGEATAQAHAALKRGGHSVRVNGTRPDPGDK